MRKSGRKAAGDIVVTKSVSLPLSMVNAIAEEQVVMGTGFSETLTTLLLLSLNLRKDRREEVVNGDAKNATK